MTEVCGWQEVWRRSTASTTTQLLEPPPGHEATGQVFPLRVRLQSEPVLRGQRSPSTSQSIDLLVMRLSESLSLEPTEHSRRHHRFYVSLSTHNCKCHIWPRAAPWSVGKEASNPYQGWLVWSYSDTSGFPLTWGICESVSGTCDFNLEKKSLGPINVLSDCLLK